MEYGAAAADVSGLFYLDQGSAFLTDRKEEFRILGTTGSPFTPVHGALHLVGRMDGFRQR